MAVLVRKGSIFPVEIEIVKSIMVDHVVSIQSKLILSYNVILIILQIILLASFSSATKSLFPEATKSLFTLLRLPPIYIKGLSIYMVMMFVYRLDLARYIQMRFESIIIAGLMVACCAIGITVDSQQDRCMVVFAQNSNEHLKIDIKFAPFHEQTKEEYYRVQLINTETHTIQDYNITSGVLRKQIQLTENVIYKLCMRMMTSSGRKGEVQQFVQYNCLMQHAANAYQDYIKVPENLLKVSDLSDAYSQLKYLNNINKETMETANNQRLQQNDIFSQQIKIMSKIEFITIVECLAILVFAVYQYLRLKHYIQNKQRQ